MPKLFFKSAVFLSAGLFLFGCSSSGMEVRGYVQDKSRVDQDLQGNAGYLAGTPKFETPTKPTRKVYILEVTKENKEKIKEQEKSPGAPQGTQSSEQPTSQQPPVDNRNSYSPPQISLPNNEDVTPPSKSAPPENVAGQPGQYTEYKVEKDDTLQKISKKFYDAFGKWTKIYEVNKDVIKNPDRIKPGTVIKIPKE